MPGCSEFMRHENIHSWSQLAVDLRLKSSFLCITNSVQVMKSPQKPAEKRSQHINPFKESSSKTEISKMICMRWDPFRKEMHPNCQPEHEFGETISRGQSRNQFGRGRSAWGLSVDGLTFNKQGVVRCPLNAFKRLVGTLDWLAENASW